MGLGEPGGGGRETERCGGKRSYIPEVLYERGINKKFKGKNVENFSVMRFLNLKKIKVNFF